MPRKLASDPGAPPKPNDMATTPRGGLGPPRRWPVSNRQTPQEGSALIGQPGMSDVAAVAVRGAGSSSWPFVRREPHHVCSVRRAFGDRHDVVDAGWSPIGLIGQQQQPTDVVAERPKSLLTARGKSFCCLRSPSRALLRASLTRRRRAAGNHTARLTSQSRIDARVNFFGMTVVGDARQDRRDDVVARRVEVRHAGR
jgi:hypothetical protein